MDRNKRTLEIWERSFQKKVVQVRFEYKHNGSLYLVRMQGTGLSRNIKRIVFLAITQEHKPFQPRDKRFKCES